MSEETTRVFCQKSDVELTLTKDTGTGFVHFVCRDCSLYEPVDLGDGEPTETTGDCRFFDTRGAVGHLNEHERAGHRAPVIQELIDAVASGPIRYDDFSPEVTLAADQFERTERAAAKKLRALLSTPTRTPTSSQATGFFIGTKEEIRGDEVHEDYYEFVRRTHQNVAH